ncbi:sphingomyelin phosphodiesterase [Kribbella sp. NPDC058245]|uniref:sphingomyelin phosphodiesterase n=1 Tax=Kribbella sp. NPDC058245 TaxID=3346399 RepID=UPI0036E510B0
MAAGFGLTLITYNILQLPLFGSARRAALAAQVLETADADIVVLNEAFNRPARRLVLHGLGKRGYAVTPEVGRKNRAWTSASGRDRRWSTLAGGGIYIASRLPVLEQHQHRYRAYKPLTSDALSNKGAALVALQTPVGRLWVAATHLQADERGSHHAVRMQQLDELRRFVASTAGAGEPVLVVGDLNVEYYPDGRDLAEAERTLGGTILTGPIHEPTFDGSLNRVLPHRYRTYRNVLDYVGSIGPSLEITTRTLTDETARDASDHFPVQATVTIS